MARKSEKASCWNNCSGLNSKYFSCNLIYPKSPRLKKRASRKHFEASVEKKEPQGTFLSLGLQPRLQKPFPQFPFFYLGFKNLLLAAHFSTLITWSKIDLFAAPSIWQMCFYPGWRLPEFSNNIISGRISYSQYCETCTMLFNWKSHHFVKGKKSALIIEQYFFIK